MSTQQKQCMRHRHSPKAVYACKNTHQKQRMRVCTSTHQKRCMCVQPPTKGSAHRAVWPECWLAVTADVLLLLLCWHCLQLFLLLLLLLLGHRAGASAATAR
eukprot:1159622-Pelagomonas_calceolata.AAC.2